MKKRALSLLLALVMVFGLLPVNALAWSELDNGLMYEVYEDHVEITGYYGDDEEVVIPAQIEGLPVTVIGSWAFSECYSLTSVFIPDSVTSIEVYWLMDCENLTGIHVDENNPNYSSDNHGVLFDKEKTLLIRAPATIADSYDIPDRVTSIGDGAFSGCENLTGIDIPESVISIGAYAFSSCSSLTGIIIPDGVTSIGEGAFYRCDSLTSINIPDSVTSIAEECFSGCFSLTSVVIPDSVTSIGESAFCHCNLTSVHIPNSVTTIGNWAFFDCSELPDITIPESVTSIGTGAFACCDTLTGIYVDKNNPVYSSDDRGVLFDKAKTTLLQAPGLIQPIAEPTKTYSIPDTVTAIGDEAFRGCAFLRGVNIPDSVTSIGYSAFATCINLNNFDIPDSVTSIGEHAFFDCISLTSISIPEGITSISNDAFEGCEGLVNIYIPNTVTSIGDGAFFRCRSLSSIELPNSITYIGDYAFQECTSLTGIDIPDNVTSIGWETFRDCHNLTSIVIPGSIIDIQDAAFDCCYNLTSILFEGGAPEFGYDPFSDVTATAYYPASDSTWTKEVMQDYDGDITWIGYNPEGSFYDVQMDSWYEAPVEWAAEQGITNGATGDTFNPNGECLRAQVVTFLWRAAGCPEPKSSVNPFVDVKERDFYYKAVLWAVENGITTGADATHFNPAGVCNRAQIVTFLYRAFGSPAVDTKDLPFTDVPAASWCAAPVAWAVMNDITNGLSATSFGPETICNRAQVVTFLYRAYN